MEAIKLLLRGRIEQTLVDERRCVESQWLTAADGHLSRRQEVKDILAWIERQQKAESE